MARKQKRRATRRKLSRNTQKRKTNKQSRLRKSSRRQISRTRELAAINRVRSGRSKTVTAAARDEGTSLDSIKRKLPKALLPSRKGKRLRVRASDPYSHLVEILTDSGSEVTMAHGSRERERAGQHRATWLSVLRREQPPSILRKFRGKKAGGRKLLTNPERLFELARGGEFDKPVPLYVVPDASV